MHLIHAAVGGRTGGLLEEVAIHVERRTLAKRLWRASAVDGSEFGFELSQPLRHRDVVLVTENSRYVVRQVPENVLEVSLEVTPELAAAAGWIAGNLHCPVEIQAGRLLAPDEKGLRQAWERANIIFREACEVFQPSGHTAKAGHGPQAANSFGANA